MPSLRTPSVSTPAPAPAASSSGPSSAPQSSAPTAAEGTPEWMSRYNFSAGNAATLSLITGGGVADEASASAALSGTQPAGPAAAPAATTAPAEEEATPSHAPRGALASVYAKNDQRTSNMKLTLTASQKGELKIFQDNWTKNHARYEAVAAQTGVPAKLIAAIHYREASLRWDTYLHQGDPLGKKAIHHPSNIPIFYKWEDAAVHALNLKKGVKDSMGMDASTTDPEALATYAEAYNGLGYHNKGKASPYVYGGTDQYKGGRYVADGVYDSRSWDQRVGVMALMDSVDGADLGAASAPDRSGPSAEDGWALVVEGKDFLANGSSGAAVRTLQTKLNAAGFACGVDGSFGPGTANAVRNFQKANGLPADGKVGPATAAKLDGKEGPAAAPVASPAAPTQNPEWARVLAGGLFIHRGDEGEHVKMVQEALVKHGFPVPVDSDFGGTTERAVLAFQRANRLPADGVVGRKTAQALQG